MISLVNNQAVINSVHAQSAGVSDPVVSIINTNNPSIDYDLLSSVIIPTRVKDYSEDNQKPFKSITILSQNDGIVIEVSDWCQLFVSDANAERSDGELLVVHVETSKLLTKPDSTMAGRTRGEWIKITHPIPKGQYKILNNSPMDCSITHIYAAPVNDANRRLAADKIVRELVKHHLISGINDRIVEIDDKVVNARNQTESDAILLSTINNIINSSLSNDPIKTMIDEAISLSKLTLCENDMVLSINHIYNIVKNDDEVKQVLESIKLDIGSTSEDVLMVMDMVVKEIVSKSTESSINYLINTTSPVTSNHPESTAGIIKHGKATTTDGRLVIVPDEVVLSINNFTTTLTNEPCIDKWEQLIIDNISEEPGCSMLFLTEQVILGIVGQDFDSSKTLAMMIVAMHSKL